MDAESSGQLLYRFPRSIRLRKIAGLVGVEPNLGWKEAGRTLGRRTDVALTSSLGNVSSPALGFE